MASWSSVGHGMRRRMGAPSSHLEAAGNSMARNHETAEEAMEHAVALGSAKVPAGYAGTLVPRKNTQAADPTNPGSKANRQNIERVGATYRVTANINPVHDPVAGPTMANARIVPSIQGRENPNFESGIQASY